MKRLNISSDAVWESRYGYSRGVRVGDLVYITGTAPVSPDGATHAPGDAFAQTVRCYEIIDAALRECGAKREDVVRARMFVTDIEQSDAFGRGHKQYFGDVMPCLTMVEVSRLIAPDMLIEIEVDAVAREENTASS